MPAALQVPVNSSRSISTQGENRDLQQVCSSIFQPVMALLWVSTATYWCSSGIWLAPSLSVITKPPRPGALKDQHVSASRILVTYFAPGVANWRTVGKSRRYGCKAHQIGLVNTSRHKETKLVLKILTSDWVSVFRPQCRMPCTRLIQAQMDPGPNPHWMGHLT